MATYLDYWPRHTGRTYRCLLRSLLAASEGNKLIFMAETEGSIPLLQGIALDLTSMLRGMQYDATLITFPNGGLVHFVAKSTKIRGLKYDIKIKDEL